MCQVSGTTELTILSVLLCSIVRLAVVVETQATTKPEFDPSWYGATTIGLSILEINVATIVAALPVFWPHLQKNLDKIMITREIEIKVTGSSGFNQIESNDDKSKRRTQWLSDRNKPLPSDPESVAMTSIKSTNDKSGGTQFGQIDFDAGAPFDGSRSNSRATTQTHARMKSSHSAASQSHEVLIHKA